MLMSGCGRYVIDNRIPYDRLGLRTVGHLMVLMDVGMPFDRLRVTSLSDSMA